MRRTLIPAFIAFVAVAAMAAVSATPVAARPPAVATGTFTFLSDTLSPIRSADGNIFLGEVASISYAGDLTGVVVATDTLLVHSDGSVDGHGTEVCSSCTIGGRTGSLTAVFAFHVSGGQLTGTETFTSAAGGLSGLRGGGTFEGNGAVNTYSYSYHFEP
jgi:hypothetical protein